MIPNWQHHPTAMPFFFSRSTRRNSSSVSVAPMAIITQKMKKT